MAYFFSDFKEEANIIMKDGKRRLKKGKYIYQTRQRNKCTKPDKTHEYWSCLKEYMGCSAMAFTREIRGVAMVYFGRDHDEAAHKEKEIEDIRGIKSD